MPTFVLAVHRFGPDTSITLASNSKIALWESGEDGILAFLPAPCGAHDR